MRRGLPDWYRSQTSVVKRRYVQVAGAGAAKSRNDSNWACQCGILFQPIPPSDGSANLCGKNFKANALDFMHRKTEREQMTACRYSIYFFFNANW